MVDATDTLIEGGKTTVEFIEKLFSNLLETLQGVFQLVEDFSKIIQSFFRKTCR
jgi:hypothetical protein